MGSALRNLAMRSLNNNGARNNRCRLSSSLTGSKIRSASGSSGDGGCGGSSAAAVAAGLVLFSMGITASAFPSYSQHHQRTQTHIQSKLVGANSLPLPERFLGPRTRVALCESASSSAAAQDVTEIQYSQRDAEFLSYMNTNSNNTTSTDPGYYYERVKEPPRSLSESHAIFGPLRGTGRIERYAFYRRVDTDKTSIRRSRDETRPVEVAVGDIQLGNEVNGHPGIVHGGIISLLFDDAMGWGYEAMAMTTPELLEGSEADNAEKIVTANLNIDFRAPLPESTRAVVRVYFVKCEGRKIYFTARLESHDGTKLYSEATSLFIVLRKEPKEKEEEPQK